MPFKKSAKAYKIGSSATRSDYEKVIAATVAARLAASTYEDLRAMGDPTQVADRMAAVIPSPHPFNRDIGPFYDTSDLVAWLQVSRQSLNQRVRTRSLLGCPTDGGQKAYPTWQFRNDGTTIPGLKDVLDALSDGTKDPWTWAGWMSARVPGVNRGLSAREWLRDGRDPQVIIDQAHRDAARWAR